MASPSFFSCPGQTEPSLEELLAEPIVRQVMARDGIASATFEAQFRRIWPPIHPDSVKPTAPSFF